MATVQPARKAAGITQLNQTSTLELNQGDAEGASQHHRRCAVRSAPNESGLVFETHDINISDDPCAPVRSVLAAVSRSVDRKSAAMAQRAFWICSKVLVAAEFIVSNVWWATLVESSKSSLV